MASMQEVPATPAPAAPAAPPVPAMASRAPPAADAAAWPAARVAAPPPAAAKGRATDPAPHAQEALSDAPDADVPPATVDTPEVRDAWLRRIGELQRQGLTTEARASLAEFRRRYPEAVLPAALRALEAPQAQPPSR